MVVIDAVTRLIPGALGDPDGAADDCTPPGLLEYPHYTRPPDFRGRAVPESAALGDHAQIVPLATGAVYIAHLCSAAQNLLDKSATYSSKT